MEHRPKRQKLSRVQAPYRRAFDAGHLSDASDAAVLERSLSKKGSEPPAEHRRGPSPLREMKGHRVVGDMHRKMHRRQLALPSDLTVIVKVIATVDQNGKTLGVQTVSAAPTVASAASVASALALPSAPSIVSALAAPSVSVSSAPAFSSISAAPGVPSVPAVPPFPSDLTVPAVPKFPSLSLPSVPSYPFTSTAGSAQLTAASIQVQGSQVVLSSPPLTFSPATTSLLGTISSSASANSTISSSSPVVSVAGISSTVSVSGNSSIVLSSTSFSVNLNSTISSTSELTSTSQVSSSQSFGTTSSSSQTISSATTTVLGGGIVPGGTGAASSTPTAATGNGNGNGEGNSSGNNGISTPKVVGSVIGSLAGLAILLVIALFFLRRYKRKRQGAIQLSTNDTTNTGPMALSGQPMAQRTSFIPPAASSFLSRFSGSSKGTVGAGGAAQERGFQKISGRKLPSAFSEGMTSDSAPFDRATLSGSSFYRDSQGFYGGTGVPAASAAGGLSREGAITEEKLMPSPARTPVIHHPEEAPPFRGGPSTNPPSPPLSPVPLPLGTLGRSHPSHDGSRGSKFTEDV